MKIPVNSSSLIQTQTHSKSQSQSRDKEAHYKQLIKEKKKQNANMYVLASAAAGARTGLVSGGSDSGLLGFNDPNPTTGIENSIGKNISFKSTSSKTLQPNSNSTTYDFKNQNQALSQVDKEKDVNLAILQTATSPLPESIASKICGNVQPNESKRNKDLHQRFPEIPSTELLIQDYVCALGRGSKLYQGRMYLTRKRICFFSSRLGIIFRVTMFFEDIQSIKRKVSVVFIPNAIEIVSDSKIYILCSFLSRDAAYDKLVSIWKISNISSFFSTSLEGEFVAFANNAIDSGASRPNSPDSHKEFTSKYLSTVWNLMHGDEPCHLSAPLSFLDWFLTIHKNIKNLEKTPWSGPNQSQALPYSQATPGQTRVFTFDMPVNIQTIQSTQHFKITHVGPHSICIESRTTNSGVPFASSYATLIYTCMHRHEGSLNETRLLISYKVEFDKDAYSIIKNPVNTAIRNRLPEFYNDLVQALREVLVVGTGDPQQHVEVVAEQDGALIKESVRDNPSHVYNYTRWYVMGALMWGVTLAWLLGLIIRLDRKVELLEIALNIKSNSPS